MQSSALSDSISQKWPIAFEFGTIQRLETLDFVKVFGQFLKTKVLNHHEAKIGPFKP